MESDEQKKDREQSKPLEPQTSFEDSIKKLESLVEEMEQGNMSLEDTLVKFEEGIKLTRSCQQTLTEAEQKIKVLSGSSTSFSTDLSDDNKD